MPYLHRDVSFMKKLRFSHILILPIIIQGIHSYTLSTRREKSNCTWLMQQFNFYNNYNMASTTFTFLPQQLYCYF